MIRFDQLVRPGATVRDVKRQYPETVPVFESLGFRDSCDDCAIESLARKHGIPVSDILQALNGRIVAQRSDLQ